MAVHNRRYISVWRLSRRVTKHLKGWAFARVNSDCLSVAASLRPKQQENNCLRICELLSACDRDASSCFTVSNLETASAMSAASSAKASGWRVSGCDQGHRILPSRTAWCRLCSICRPCASDEGYGRSRCYDFVSNRCPAQYGVLMSAASLCPVIWSLISAASTACCARRMTNPAQPSGSGDLSPIAG